MTFFFPTVICLAIHFYFSCAIHLKILINNFNQLCQGYQVEGILNNTSIDFPQQILSSTTVSGHGFITDQLQTIELQYSVEDGTGNAENVDANCSKL